MRKEIERILDSIKENGLEIQQAEKDIDQYNKTLQELSLSLVKIANETSRQHSIYKKSCLAPLDEIDYQAMLDESVYFNILNQEMEDLLSSPNSLLDQSNTEI